MQQYRIRVCHTNRLLSECLASAINQSAINDCHLLPSDALSNYQLVDESDPFDVLLLEAGLHEGAAHEFAQLIARHFPECKIILMIGKDGLDRVLDLVRIFNHACILEDAGIVDIQTALRMVLDGQYYCSPSLANLMLLQIRNVSRQSVPQLHRGVDMLTPREREILDLIETRHLGNKQISGQLGISLSTVKTHVHNIIEKLQVQDRYEAARVITGQIIYSDADKNSPQRFPTQKLERQR